MSYILVGLFTLVASLNFSYERLTDLVTNLGTTPTEITGTLYIENTGEYKDFIVITELLNSPPNLNSEYTIYAQTKDGTKIEIAYFLFSQETKEIIGTARPSGNVTFNFNKTELTQEKYNGLMTILEPTENTGVSTIYNQGYNQGYQDGLDVGGANAKEQYQAGVNAGTLDGYNKGYEEAMKVADTPYTFRNLLFAVIESPAVFIKSWLNTEILGINVAGLIFGIFTIAFIIGIGALIKHFI